MQRSVAFRGISAAVPNGIEARLVRKGPPGFICLALGVWRLGFGAGGFALGGFTPGLGGAAADRNFIMADARRYLPAGQLGKGSNA